MAQVLTKAKGGKSDSPSLNFHFATIPVLGPRDVLVKLIAAPINPLDVLVLANLYPIKPQHHQNNEEIPGYDGVGKIVSIGSAVTEIEIDDLIIPSKFGFGTWRTHAVVDVNFVQKISRPIDLAFAAILRITVTPAFCLGEDMCDLRTGDWIIQNAATSAVAQMVVQFARRRGIHTINIIRDRPTADTGAIRELLAKGGADIVLLESEVEGNTEINGKRVKLALDSVFGESGRRLIKALSPEGTYVQLGMLGGAGQQLKLDAASDIFGRQLTLKSFRGTTQLGLRSGEEQTDLFNWFISSFNAGELVLPSLGVERLCWDTSDVEGTRDTLISAVKRAQKGALGQRKQIVMFE